MKKHLSLILAVVLTLSCVLTICSCTLTICSFTEKSPAFARGTKDGNVYTNTSLGFTVTLPKGWAFYTDEQLAEISNMSADLLKDPDILDNMDVTTMYEFMAVDSTTGNNFNMTLEKVSALIKMEDWIKALKKQLEAQLSDSMSVTVSDETSEITLGNGTWTVLYTSVTSNGVQMKQYIFCRKMGTTMVSMACTDVTGVGQAYFEKLFTAIPAESATA